MRSARQNRSPMWTVLKLVVTVGTLGLLLYFVNWSDLRAAVERLPAATIFTLLFLAIPVHYFQFLRWKMLAQRAGERVDAMEIQRGYWVGFTLGLLTPGRVGQFGRALALRGCSTARALGITVIERFYAAVVINGCGMIALGVLPSLQWSPATGELTLPLRAICITLGSLIVLLGLVPFTLKRPILALAKRLPLAHKSAESIGTLDSVKFRVATKLLILAMIALAFTLLQYVICLRALGTDLPLLAGMLAALLTLFLKGMLPFTMGSLGIGEWSAMICFQGLGVPAADAVVTSLFVFTINVLIPSLIGAPFLSELKIPALPVTRAPSESAS